MNPQVNQPQTNPMNNPLKKPGLPAEEIKQQPTKTNQPEKRQVAPETPVKEKQNKEEDVPEVDTDWHQATS